jgi:polyisoprenyl-phosphate glycosyltransferase
MLSVVAPVYNEREVVGEFYRRLTDVLTPLGEYEIVFVDDGSTDGTWDILRALATTDPRLRLFRLSRNFGHQAALSAGLDAARGEAIVTIDADLQDPPELIPQLVERWRDGYDVVFAVRTTRAGEARLRLAAISLFYRLIGSITATDVPRDVGDYRLLSRRAADALRSMPERARFLRGMAGWIGFKQTGVEYARDPRYAGTSKYPFGSLLRLALDGIASFSTAPIRLVTALGFALVVFCIGVFAWVLYVQFAESRHPAGWTSVIGVVLLLGGVQLLSLGVIGQYVGRIFEESKRRPLYLLEEVVDSSDSSSASRWASSVF